MGRRGSPPSDREQEQALKFDFRPVRELGPCYREYSGQYLVQSLAVRTVVSDKQGNEHTIWYSQFFALDTASPVTFLNKEDLERCLPVAFEQLNLNSQEFGGRMGTDDRNEIGWCLGELEFPNIGIRLPRAFISADDRPFGLLGTDFLQHFCMRFDPSKRRAWLTRSIPTQDSHAGPAWSAPSWPDDTDEGSP